MSALIPEKLPHIHKILTQRIERHHLNPRIVSIKTKLVLIETKVYT